MTIAERNARLRCKGRGRTTVWRAGEMGGVGSWPISRVLSLDSHSSSLAVTDKLKQPTRVQRGPRQCTPIWSCSGWGLACRAHCCVRGALLPHLFTLACAAATLAGDCGHRRFSSLFHFPSPLGAWPLASILPCGARTFLPVQARGDCLSNFPARIVPQTPA